MAAGELLHLDDVALEELARVLEKDLPLDGFVCGVGADRLDGSRALAAGAAADGIRAIAAVEDLVLVLLEEPARVFFVAEQRVEAGAGGHVGEAVWIVAEIFVGQPAARDRA